jgi:hypothetical protein
MTIPGRLAACVTPHAGYHPLNLTKQVWILGTGRKPRHRPQPPSVGDILHRRACWSRDSCHTDLRSWRAANFLDRHDERRRDHAVPVLHDCDGSESCRPVHVAGCADAGAGSRPVSWGRQAL